MSVRSRHAPPPYQVMKAHPPASPAWRDNSSPPSPLSWSARAPLTLRLPRGILLLAALAVVAVAVLGYWVGWSRGYRAGIQHMTSTPALASLPGIVSPSSPGPSASPPASSATSTTSPSTQQGPLRPTPVPGLVVRPPSADRRQIGLNYFVANLVGADEALAARVTAFLWQEGVETQAVQLHNKKLFKLIALRGFAKEELGSPACVQYEQLLQRAARLWKAQNPRSVDLTGMYAERYTGEAVDLVITREDQP